METTAAPNATTEPTATTTQSTDTSVLDQAKQQAAPPINERIPEKFRVMKGDQIDLEASTAKMAESYTYLEKRMGAHEAPPKSPEEYAPKVEIEGLDWQDFSSDARMQSFLAEAHKRGINNDQLGFLVEQYIGSSAELLDYRDTEDAESCSTALREMWGSEEEYNQGVTHAVRAVQNIFGDDAEDIIARNGNNSDFILLASFIGQEMQEDSPPLSMQTIDPVTFDSQVADLKASMDGMGKNDPRRAHILKQISDLYAKRYGDAPAHGL